MIVDDERLVRQGIRTSIDWAEQGIEIAAEAKNGEDALRQLAACPFDLIVSDIRMPVLSGLDLAREIKRSRLPVEIVLLSGYEDFGYATEAMRLGVRDYLLKPVTAEKLVETIAGFRDELLEKQNVRGTRKGAASEPAKTMPELQPMQQPVQQPRQTIRTKQPGKLVKDVIRFAVEHIDQPIGLSDAAAHVEVTPSYLCKVFKDEIGMPFTKWLNCRRVEEAKTLLEQTWLKTYEIAGRVGYHDYKYFSLMFKKYAGCSPREYRNHGCAKDGS